MNKLLITNIKQLLQVDNTGHLKTVSGEKMNHLPLIENAFIYIENNLIVHFDVMTALSPALISGLLENQIIDATGKLVAPGYCDSHTHLVFATTRDGEFEDRINGLSYEEIANRGGGIINSANKLAATSQSDLLQSAIKRINEVIAIGTVALEIKSGYGLSVDGELKMLRVIKQLKQIAPIPIKANFLAAHAYPIIYRNNHKGYIDLIINEMLPVIAEEGLADYIDVFCEKGFFNLDETEQILNAGSRYGLLPKIHANQLHNIGAVQLAVSKNAVSVDHLEQIGTAEIECLLNSNTMPTLLPSAAFFINLPYQPARAMISAGLPIALASDYNPGSSPSGNMNFVMSLACTQMKMTPAEAFNATTINGAAAMQLSHLLGSIAVGKLANIFITEPCNGYAVIPYSFGKPIIETVIINGQIWKPTNK
jgi:imidazolonepropionase